jgi:epoxyqueuosine reductase QueG
LGNAPSHPRVMEALTHLMTHSSDMLREHVSWAMQAQNRRNNN